MPKKRIAFIINPKSGSDRKTDRVKLIEALLSNAYESEILPWKKIEDRERIFERAKTGGFDVVVAVGGDGTVSQVADMLCGTGIALGIIPFGSGNGLARHLGIPLDAQSAMKLLENGEIKTIDRGKFNERSFFCTAGVGFDARIGKLFAESTTRGFWTYAKMTLRELRTYKPEKYALEIDGKKFGVDAFLVAVANAGQYGNNAWISPKANVCDGQLNLTILKPFHWWNIPGIAMRIFRKTLDRSRFVEMHCGKEIRITRKEEGASHFDGEPDFSGKELKATINAGVLKVVVPAGFKG